ncbi:serine acetyltransferase [Enterobacter cloacae complex sp. 2022EL-00788]|uniref:serine acetyltransferase n=1 Tax=Enterobacter cloacae complex sp. 2022EL-00788 TaxID=2996512 RepID=UPI0022714021|nr:serine acetyltransferase [Enterobacter cloacae complex sp. 2022EL-00788]MCY0775158.1 serine acetyltransferase [Enterobacter cloacae complex sp. 2022EL-00788]
MMIDSSIQVHTSSDEALAHLKECLKLEVINRNGKKNFSWLKVLHRVAFSRKKRFYFWWRLANYMNQTPSKRYQKWARKINANLRCKYGADISIEAQIGAGMKLNHYIGIVIRSECKIGKNANIRQNTTIGRKTSDGVIGMTIIGDNVDIGAHSCIIGDVHIGNNVTIGAMTFINKDVPDDSLVYNPVTYVVKSK